MNPAREFEAIAPTRHVDICEHDRQFGVLVHHLQGLVRVLGRKHAKPDVLEFGDGIKPDERLVLDDEDGRAMTLRR